MLDFTFANVEMSEFGVGRKENGRVHFQIIPVDNGIKTALLEMAQTTWDLMQSSTDDPEPYSPGEKHASTEYLFRPMDAVPMMKFELFTRQS